MIEKNKDYYKAQVKKLKAKNKELEEENSSLAVGVIICAFGWVGFFILLIVYIQGL